MQINYDQVATNYQKDNTLEPEALDRLKPLMLAQIRRYYPSKYEMDDILQELRVVTLEALKDFDPALGTHALALIKSRMKYHLLGKYKKHIETQPIDDAFLIEDETSMDDFENLFYKDSLGKVFKSLSYEEEKLIYLRYYTEMSYEDIGRALGISKTTAHKRVTALLKKLRKLYKEVENCTAKV